MRRTTPQFNKKKKVDTRETALIIVLLLLKHEKLSQREIVKHYNELCEGKFIKAPNVLFNDEKINFNAEMSLLNILRYHGKAKTVDDKHVSRAAELLEDVEVIQRSSNEKIKGKRGPAPTMCSLISDPNAILRILILIDNISWPNLGAPHNISGYIISSDYGKLIVNNQSIERWCEDLKMDFNNFEMVHLKRILKTSPTALRWFLNKLYSSLQITKNTSKEFKESMGWGKRYFEQINTDTYLWVPPMTPETKKANEQTNRRHFFEQLLLKLGEDIKYNYTHPLLEDYDGKHFYRKDPPFSYKIVVDWSVKPRKDERLYDIHHDKIEVSF